MNIHIVDAPMGAGKTSAAINMINNSPEDTKFIYITPYKTEQDRIVEQCKVKNFKKPREEKIKIIDFKILLNKGENIVTTHVLFKMFDQEIIDLCYDQGYVLIMDEVTDVIEQFDISRQDANTLFEKYVDRGEDGILKWREEQADYSGRFSDIKRLVELKSLACYAQEEIVLWLFPVEIFKAFRTSYILTYLFNAQPQCYYYKFYNMDFDYLFIKGNSIDTYEFSENEDDYRPETINYSELIYIVDDRRLNMIGDSRTALSKSWFERNAENVLVKQLQENLNSFFNNRKSLYKDGKYMKSNVHHNLWTVFKDYKDPAGGKGYKSCYLAHNARATNNYADKSVVAYCVNRFLKPTISNFFIEHNIEVDEDGYALSEMLQFIWRSAIRNGQHITLYVPSLRMRTLLVDWIEEHSPTPVENRDELLVKSLTK